MPLKSVAILTPGDMGHAVGRALREHGLEVLTCLRGRSQRTHALAQEAGIRDVPTLEALVAQADLVLSIVVPEAAQEVARRVAAALRATGAGTLYADCNAISPETTARVAHTIGAAGGRFIDASIIGGPPGAGRPPPRFYVAGPHARAMEALDGKGIVVRSAGDTVGRASALKMCYAALTKGTSALHIALLSVAQVLGVAEELRRELEESQPDAVRFMQRQVPTIPHRAGRWVSEMEEIAATFEAAGLTPGFHRAAAEVYRLVAATPLGRETPETRDRSRTLEQTIAAIVRALPSPAARPG